MSQKNDNPVIEIAPEAEIVDAEIVEKQSFVAKTKHFVKTHKSPAIAVGALVGLVAVAAVTGRKTAPDAPIILELESNGDVHDVEVIEHTETTTA